MSLIHHLAQIWDPLAIKTKACLHQKQAQIEKQKIIINWTKIMIQKTQKSKVFKKID